MSKIKKANGGIIGFEILGERPLRRSYVGITLTEDRVTALQNAGLFRLLRYPHKYGWSAGRLIPFLRVGLSILRTEGHDSLAELVDDIYQACIAAPDNPITSFYHSGVYKEREVKPEVKLDPEKIPWKFDIRGKS